MTAAAPSPVLPDLSSDYALAAEAPAAFQRDGHITLRGMCSKAEVEPWRKVLWDATFGNAPNLAPLAERGTYGKAFVQVGDLWNKAPVTGGFCLARRFAKVAAELMGIDGVRMYHDQALYKEANGGPTPWHQDQYYWPLATDKSITMWMPLVDVTAYQGALTFATGSHAFGQLSLLSISDESQSFYSNLIKERGFKVHNVGDMAAGDCTFHAGWTLHSAPANRSDKCREVMTVIYIADGMRISKPDYPAREHDMQAFFPGRQPGDLADTHMNPLLYSRNSRST
jgi:ectoine hydroxylase-related dioxygenase (phytanoyl-CoA dioxygenase family)